MQVGDKVWVFDGNNRKYEDDKGNELNRCWYRGYFTERYIVGETKQSWIVGYKGVSIDNRNNLKVNKKTLIYSTTNMYGLDGKLRISEEDIEKECWIQENKYRIKNEVENCKDYDKLKKIEKVLLSNESSKLVEWCITALEHYKDCDIPDNEKEEIEECLRELYI